MLATLHLVVVCKGMRFFAPGKSPLQSLYSIQKSNEGQHRGCSYGTSINTWNAGVVSDHKPTPLMVVT